MRLRWVRRRLGPLEPPLHDAWLRLVAGWERWRRSVQVVVATDRDHFDRLASEAARVDADIGVWITCADDVAPIGELGWFVVRLDPAAGPGAVSDVVAAWQRACRRVRVVDLREGVADTAP